MSWGFEDGRSGAPPPFPDPGERGPRGLARGPRGGRTGARAEGLSREEITFPGLENGNVFVATRQKTPIPPLAPTSGSGS